jgi:transposase
MKLPTSTLRQVLRLLDDPRMSMREIGRICLISPNTAKTIRKLLERKALHWEALCDLDDEQLEKRLFAGEKGIARKPTPNWMAVHEELQKDDMTLSLIWEEYRQLYPEGLAYTQFTRHYRTFKRTCKLSLRQIHKPGEKIFVDFCGRTVPIRHAVTGETHEVQVFVASLGASGYLFAVAVASQKLEDWLKAHALLLNHIGGVTCYVIPDNLKAGVLKHCRKDLILNTIYEGFAEHHDFIVLPARPYKPKDKALAEIGVKIVQRWVLARLRNQVFFSLDELNSALGYWMEKLNDKTTRTYPKSRLQRFLELDAPALKASGSIHIPTAGGAIMSVLAKPTMSSSNNISIPCLVAMPTAMLTLGSAMRRSMSIVNGG